MTSSSNDTDREALLAIVERNVGIHTVNAILTEFLPGYTERVKAEAWNESAAAHRKGIVTTEWHKWPANPYRRES